MRISVRHTIDDLESDRRQQAKTWQRELGQAIRDTAREGNRLAKSFASEDHTMHGDEDILYPPSFTVQRLGRYEYEYGPDASIGDGSQATGYEFGSINSPPHYDLARSVDAIGPELGNNVSDVLRRTLF